MCEAPAPKAPLTHRAAFFRRHLSDHMTWLPGHLFPEQTGEAVGRGRDGHTHPFSWAEPVHPSIRFPMSGAAQFSARARP